MDRATAAQQRFQVVGHHLRLPRLSVPRRPTDVWREHHIRHGGQRVVGGQPLAGEMVYAGGGYLSAQQRLDQRVGVVQLRACGVEEDDVVAHGLELRCADQPGGVVGDRGVQRDDVGLRQQLVETVAGLVVVRVAGDDVQAQTGKPPLDRLTDRAEADQPGGAPGDLPGPEALVGNGAVAKHVAGPHISVGGQQVPGGGQQQRYRHLGDRVGVAGRGVQHRNPGGGGGGDVDVVGVPPRRRHRPQSQLEHRTGNRITLHHNDIGTLGGYPISKLPGGVDSQRRLVYPRVVNHISESSQLVEPVAAQRGRHQSARHDCQCWRTVTPVSRKDVTIGIDIGSTAVKAVAADEDGRVVARARVPHQLRVPAPDRLEHDADEAWRQGPLTALNRLAQPDASALAVSAMVPSLTAVDAGGRPITAGLLYGDSRGRVPAAVDDLLPPVGETAEFLRWTATEAPRATGYWPAAAVATHALAGAPVIDFATAYTAAPLFDGTGWSVAACADCGTTVDRMPPVAATGTPAGQLCGTRTVLAVGAIDALCEQIVAGADRDGDVLVSCGTTLIVWVTIPEFRQVRGLWTIPHLAAGKCQIGGASNAGGLFLSWVDRLLGPGDVTGVDPRRVPVWSPYIRGERTPFHDPDRRGVLDGLDLTHDAAAVRRAAYEASGFVVRRLIELSGAPVSRVLAAGGGTRVPGWIQAIADATGQPVQLSKVADGAALGAAFVARMAVGLEPSITDARRWAAVERIVEPNPAWTAPLEDRYHRFLELADRPGPSRPDPGACR
jgi:xylulokinase